MKKEKEKWIKLKWIREGIKGKKKRKGNKSPKKNWKK